jgi:hypothetical protein
LPTATNAPATVVVAATSSPFAIKKSAINPAATSTNGGALTVTGQGMTAGAALYATVASNDKSGSTCLELIPQGQTSGTACAYPAAGSTPAPVGVTKSGDQVAVQYNNGATPPTGSFNITVTANGGTSPLTPFAMNYPAPVIGAVNNASLQPWGGGIVYANNNIYYTLNSKTTPLAVEPYSNGAAGSTIGSITASQALTNAPAGGLIIGPDNNFWGTEQNATKAFKITPSGSTTEYSLTCPSGSAGATGVGSSQVLGPQTGITTDGTNVYVLCANVASITSGTPDGGDNTINTINASSGTVTACSLKSGGGHAQGPFGNGAVYANGYIYSEDMFSPGSGAGGGGGGGDWIAIPVTNCGQFNEMTNAGMTGSGNVWLFKDNNLYSETDSLLGTPSGQNVSGFTAANPTFANSGSNIQRGGGGLAMDTVLGSGFFVGTADAVDSIVQTKWTGGTQIIPNTYVPLASGGTAIAPGSCEVAYNDGGGVGIIQLPDGKFAWPVGTDALEPSTHNNLCFLNP